MIFFYAGNMKVAEKPLIGKEQLVITQGRFLIVANIPWIRV